MKLAWKLIEALPNYNTKKVYVDIAGGSDVNGTGSILSPYQTIPAALAAIALAGPGQYDMVLSPGSYSGAPIAWPNNVSLSGTSGVSVDHDISFVSVAAASEFLGFSGIEFNGALSFDLSASFQSIVLFQGCGNLDLSRLDNTGGGHFIQILDSSIRALDIIGNVGVFNSLFTGAGTYTVQAAGNLILTGCLQALPMTVDGNLQLNACTVPAGASTFSGSGTIFSDASSLGQGAVVAGPTVMPLDTTPFQGYTPGTPANWAGSPTTSQEAIDRLAAAVAGLLGGAIP